MQFEVINHQVIRFMAILWFERGQNGVWKGIFESDQVIGSTVWTNGSKICRAMKETTKKWHVIFHLENYRLQHQTTHHLYGVFNYHSGWKMKRRLQRITIPFFRKKRHVVWRPRFKKKKKIEFSNFFQKIHKRIFD